MKMRWNSLSRKVKEYLEEWRSEYDNVESDNWRDSTWVKVIKFKLDEVLKLIATSEEKVNG